MLAINILQLAVFLHASQAYVFIPIENPELTTPNVINIPSQYSESAWLEEFQSTDDDSPAKLFQQIHLGDLFEGDMIVTGNITEEQFRQNLGFTADEIPPLRAVGNLTAENFTEFGHTASEQANGKQPLPPPLSEPEYKWPNAEVPFVFAYDCSETLRKTWQKAVEFFRAYTCVILRPKTASDMEHVYISQETRECGSSDVGRIVRFKNDLKIGFSCESSLLTVIHEIMHSLGFIHEQSRPDRDQYVSIAFENIMPSQYKNFQAYTRSQIKNLGLPYDFYSIMHYTWNAFSNSPDTKPTVIAKDTNLIVGQQKFLSLQDITQIKMHYNCPNIFSHVNAACPLTKPFKCTHTIGCVEKNKVCDGNDDCGDNSDEQRCSSPKNSDSTRIWKLLKATAARIANQKYPPGFHK